MAEDRTPPYTSAGDLDRLFERIKTLGEPGKVDSKWVESYKIAKSQPQAVVSVLRWLGVIDDDGASQGVWSDLRTKRAETLERLITSSYADVFSRVDVSAASREDIEGTFITAYSTGSTDRPVKCFLALCSHAGIETNAVQRRTTQKHSTSPATAKVQKPNKTSAASGNTSGPRKTKLGADDGALDIAVTLNVEIPADWNDEQVRQRVEAVRKAIA
jgi:hypothetical protein